MMKKLINVIALAVLVSVNALTPFSYAMTALPDNPLNEGTIEYNRKGGYIQLTYNDKKIRIRDKNVGATKVAVNDYIPLYNLGREYYDNFGYNPCGIVPTKGSVPSEEYYETEFLARAQELLGLSEPLTCDDVEEIEMLYNSGTYNSYENSAYIASFGNYYFRGNNTGAKREDLNVDLDNMEVNIDSEIIEKGFDGGKIGEKDTGWEKGETNNPCDSNNGEYLPTPDDWKKLMQYRGGIKGYELMHRREGLDIYGFDEEDAMSKFAQDMRIPNAGVIIDLGDATIFSFTGRGLWATKDDIRIGAMSLDGGLGVVPISEVGEGNGGATSVRCFVYIDPVTVNFYSGNDTLKTIKVEKGETVDELEMPARDGYIYKWNTASGEEWDFSKPLTSNTDLYLEWQECEEGYEVVKNQCVAEGSAGVKHKNGLIKISDGKDTIYLKDRNEGNIDDEMVDDYKFLLNAGAAFDDGPLYDEFEEQCDYDEECVNEKALEYIEEKTGKHFDSEEEVEEYGRNMLEKYGDGNDGLEGLLKKMVGNFYFRGNNTGVSWDELVIEDGKIMNKSELVQKGFDGGKFGNIDGSGWIEGNYNNPCDWSKGEYLPTPNDWKNLLGVWSNIYGYEVEDLGNNIPIDNVFIEGFDDEIELILFMVDTLMTSPIFSNVIVDMGDGMIFQDHNIGLWNGQAKNGEIGVTMLNDMGLFVEYFNPENVLEEFLVGINSGAMSVRCFVKVPVVKFETKGGSPMNDTEVFKGEKLVIKKQPTKSNATFDGWYRDAGLTEKWDIDNDVVEDDMTLYAKWIETKSSGGSSSGGGGGGSNNTSNDDKNNTDKNNTDKDNTDKDNTDKTVDDKQNVNDANSQNDDNNPEKGSNKITQGQSNSEKSEYSDEFQQAYQFSKRNGITTMSTIQRAKMNSPLTRIAMAKMLSQYAINVLGKMPDISKGTIKFNDVTNKMDKDYDNGVTLAYQLGIMGQNMPNNKFRPKDEVTRAEFVAAFSRMLYGTSDGEYKSTSKYYTHHMEKLKSEGIVTNTNPSMKERRGYVMIMLMRSAK